MNYTQAIKYIEDRSWSASRPGLDRTRELLRLMGDPQKKLRFVHVAGSNGKGSTCAMLASVLTAAGYKTGLYSSPHLISFNERMKIDGISIADKRLASIVEAIRPLADGMDDHPTEFELSTATAMQYFAEEMCHVVVLEVGMGGELDSTNVINAPEVSVITNIGLEHTEYLGDTIEAIAGAKAGIIKRGCPCVSYDLQPVAAHVIRERCRLLSAPLYVVPSESLTPLKDDGLIKSDAHGNTASSGQVKSDGSSELSEGVSTHGCTAPEHLPEGQRFLFNGNEYTVSLLGKHQLHNAAVVLTVTDVLRRRGFSIPENAVRSGLASVTWPARFEILMKSPTFVLDGGHNPQCAECLAASLRDYLPGKKICFILALLADKDADRILDTLLPFASRVICTTPDSPRALNGKELSSLVSKRGIKSEYAATATAAVESAISRTVYRNDSSENDFAGNSAVGSRADGETAVVAFGSLYMAGEILRTWRSAVKKALRRYGISARESLGAEDRRQRSDDVVSGIASLDVFRKSDKVMIYSAVRSEVDIFGLMRLVPDKTYIFPKCISGTEMIAVIPDPESGWTCGAFGISEPVVNNSNIVAPHDIDLIICPLTAFDPGKNRIGMGAGYYDRFLAGKSSAAPVIGAAFACQMVAEIPCDETDFPLDGIITENGVLV